MIQDIKHMLTITEEISHSLDLFYGRRTPKPPTFKETFLTKELARAIGGAYEVVTPVGRIDLLRDDLILEIKIAKYAKQAVGQLFCYDLYYKRPNRGIGIIGKMPRWFPPVCEELDLILLHYSLNEFRWRVY